MFNVPWANEKLRMARSVEVFNRD